MCSNDEQALTEKILSKLGLGNYQVWWAEKPNDFRYCMLLLDTLIDLLIFGTSFTARKDKSVPKSWSNWHFGL